MVSNGRVQLALWIASAVVAGIDGLTGEIVPFSAAPHHLSMRVNGTHVCGATLVTDTWLLTAAQCVRGVEPEWVTLQAGANYNVDERVVLELIAHPDYEPYTLDNDVALIRINESTPYNATEPVKVIRVIEANYDLAPGSLANLTGYGPVLASWPPLRGANVTLISYDECRLQYYQTDLTDSMLCGAVEGELQAGDAGGALVARAYAVGLSSHQLGRRAGVFTRLALPRVRSFIQQHTSV